MDFPNNTNLVVCRDYLEGNCPETDETCYVGIHKYDISKMPFCPSILNNEKCNIENCIYKHYHSEQCQLYTFGFCPNGPMCPSEHFNKPTACPCPLRNLFNKSRPSPPSPFLKNNAGSYVRSSLRLGNHLPISPAILEVVSHHESQRQIQYRFQNQQPNQLPNFQNQALPDHHRTCYPKQGLAASCLQEGLQFDKKEQQEERIHPDSNVSEEFSVFEPPGYCRYFLMKCTEQILQIAARKGMWGVCSKHVNTLQQAFREADHVFLFISINTSLKYQGFAKMTSDFNRGCHVWPKIDGTGELVLKDNFSIKWLKLGELAFRETCFWDMRNSLNNNELVGKSPDGQEIAAPVAEVLANLILQSEDSSLAEVAREGGKMMSKRDRRLIFTYI